jgi:hypothetical protein
MTSRTRILVAVTALIATASLAAVAAAGTITTFEFQRSSNTNSLLTIYRQDTLDGRILNIASYRAGSGLNGNECDSAAYDNVGGWLPAGYYSLWGHWNNYQGSLIQGRVWRLQDKRCQGGAGTLRTELFIHSEETAGNEQACHTPYIERFCWDGDGDYYSVGCIKVSRAYPPSPTDLGRLHANWDNWSGLHGSFTLQQRLYVY